MLGVWLLLVHPELPPCEMCKRFVFRHDWQPEMVGGPDGPATVHMERPEGCPTPCEICPKIPKGKEPRPHNAAELSAKNWRAWQHWQECRAVGRFPEDDAIVRRNAALIQQAWDSFERMQSSNGAAAAVLGFFKKG